MASHCSRSLGQHAWELADAALLEPFSGSGHGEDSHAWVPAAAERPGADVVMEQFQEVALEFPLPDLQALEDMCTDAPAAPPSPTETPGPVPRRKAARKVKNQISPELHMEHSPYLSMKGGGVFIMDQPGEGPDSDKSWNISEDGIFTGSQTVPRSDGAQDQGPQKPVCLSPLLIPVSVPVPDRSTDVQEKTWLQTASSSGGQEHLKSLIMPPLSEAGGALAGRRSWAAGGSLSQLILAYQPPPYTPPPMLSPLYLSAALDNVDRIAVDVVTISPKINVGPRFQAEIPPLRNPLMLLYDEHPAQLVWAPWRGLPSNAEMQKRVSDFLDLCSSSVLPGGGTNTELALHCLHEVQGNVLAALDLLMLRGDYRSSAHPLNDYHYTGALLVILY
ncbi:zinc finger protein 541-like [Denticeps clupeoides]|uniref:zinc finger protein 541-like n=1 Tax=Denticeps clupeoides TaxID=299321 RepID=UPI0010A424EB|nr:zinc finger protein 541-like [Denticeps clupeoides]